MATEEELKKKFLEDFGAGTKKSGDFTLLKIKEDGTVDLDFVQNIVKEGGPKAAQILRELDYWHKNVADESAITRSFVIPESNFIANFGGGLTARNRMLFDLVASQKKTDEAAGLEPWSPQTKAPDSSTIAAQEEADKKVLEQDATDRFMLAAQRADIIRPSFGLGNMANQQPESMLAPGLGAYKPKRTGILKARGIL